MVQAGIASQIKKMASVDLFERDATSGHWATGLFVGRPFYLDYDKALLLVADSWKQRAKGIPFGAFLLAYYENEENVSEALLLRVLRPTQLPTDSEIIGSMIEYYKENLRTAGKSSQLDSFTKYEFSFSGLETRVLGTFFFNEKTQRVQFGADVENFYSAHNYSVVKPNPKVLEEIVNYREGMIVGGQTDIELGCVRYSSSNRFQEGEPKVPVMVSAFDFLGKRTALFGMTRTGKSNTVKKVIQATVTMSKKAKLELKSAKAEDGTDAFTKEKLPKYPVGQIVFDINGEYSNVNLQDDGTAIFEIYKDQVVRYSVQEKPGFRVMKVNFYKDVEAGFGLIKSNLGQDGADYIKSFSSIDLTPPEDNDPSAKTRFERKRAAYLCCLKLAGFTVPAGFKVKFPGQKDLNLLVQEDGDIDPSKGITLDQAADWFKAIWENSDSEFFVKYKKTKGHDWIDEDLRAILVFLSRKSKPNGNVTISGYTKIRNLANLHTAVSDSSFEVDIVDLLRLGKIVLVDLSQGDPEIQGLYSERICRRIFDDSMKNFVAAKPNNVIQFYFEEAHNLFPKKDEKDLSQIYNRVAKEGAKLNLGLIYATQEVSSISSNILKNTQNWFIAHLNNDEETREIKKYYDFGDFSESLIRFSPASDKGFVRMKTYSNPFVVPVQVDRFSKE